MKLFDKDSDVLVDYTPDSDSPAPRHASAAVEAACRCCWVLPAAAAALADMMVAQRNTSYTHGQDTRQSPSGRRVVMMLNSCYLVR